MPKRFGVKTAETVWQAQAKCPGLVLLPPHHALYGEVSREINRIYLSVTDQVEPFSVDESWLDVTASRTLFGSGVEIADSLRKRVRDEIGITISVGVSFNKTWAKMGSDYKKPDATTVMDRESAPKLLYPQPIENMLFVGSSAAQVLSERYSRPSVTWPQPIACASVLRSGKSGVSLSAAARGEDMSPVRVYGDTDPARSVSHACTFPSDLVGRDACTRELLPLCEAVGTRLRKMGLRCRTVQLQIKSPDLKVISRQRTLSLPTASTDRIFREVCAILQDSWPEQKPVRLFSVGAENLISDQEDIPVQLSLLDDAEEKDEKRERLEAAVDRLRDRFGRDSVMRGKTKH